MIKFLICFSLMSRLLLKGGGGEHCKLPWAPNFGLGLFNKTEKRWILSSLYNFFKLKYQKNNKIKLSEFVRTFLFAGQKNWVQGSYSWMHMYKISDNVPFYFSKNSSFCQKSKELENSENLKIVNFKILNQRAQNFKKIIFNA